MSIFVLWSGCTSSVALHECVTVGRQVNTLILVLFLLLSFQSCAYVCGQSAAGKVLRGAQSRETTVRSGNPTSLNYKVGLEEILMSTQPAVVTAGRFWDLVCVYTFSLSTLNRRGLGSNKYMILKL